MNNPLAYYDLSYSNTMALSCIARYAMILDNQDTLQDDIKYAIDFAAQHGLPLFVLSFGSNVILPSDLNALVLLPRIKGVEMIHENDSHVTLQVACGENWHEFIKTCLERGYYGLENLALIPGLVGASPVQNIGAYGVQVSDFIKRVVAFDLQDGAKIVFEHTACSFDYRHSFFKDNEGRYLISHVVFELHKDKNKTRTSYGDVAQIAIQIAKQRGQDKPDPMDVFLAVVVIRQNKLPDPDVLANCGSFFQNPIISINKFNALKQIFSDIPSYPIDDHIIKISAGWLIDKAGLKGKGIAPILTHEKQALVLTNHAPRTATQDDIKTTQDFIIKTVQDKFGISLVREPVWVD
ncbi:MAG: UDP-N-acetylmuramate dehydrogenase [Moraxella sp.]|nr:UDP-N-acetylmuramate dehydrogenase [Moraxella sp.]